MTHSSDFAFSVTLLLSDVYEVWWCNLMLYIRLFPVESSKTLQQLRHSGGRS